MANNKWDNTYVLLPTDPKKVLKWTSISTLDDPTNVVVNRRWMTRAQVCSTAYYSQK